MKITKLVRNHENVLVYLLDDSGKISLRTFSKNMSNDEIKAEITGAPKPGKNLFRDVTEKAEKVPTIPAPEPVNRPRVSREQMIAALTAAKIEVDVFDPAKLRAAYKELIAKGGENK